MLGYDGDEPLGCTSHLKPKMYGWSRERQLDIASAESSHPASVRIIDDDGGSASRRCNDGTAGLIRGPWVASCYFRFLAGEVRRWMAGYGRYRDDR
jgi:hypothetical protein